ncbi:hypothetical protein [Brevibacillus centrosporus]|uniref:hypothetical protein n=1 Tax=Brevibacillus centrosporus TaxID=54910 RepID=UPI002E1AADFF|nr:hypothetical protein [Brevibacillus centrosporus]
MNKSRKFMVVPVDPPKENSYSEARAHGKFSSITIDGLKSHGYNEIKSGLDEHAATSDEGGVNNMSDNSFKYLLDRLDQDIRDHKHEVRDRDQRIQNEMAEREERNREERKFLEERIIALVQKQSEEAKEREYRVLKAIDDIQQTVLRSEDRIDNAAKHLENVKIANTSKILTIVALIIAIAALGNDIVSNWFADLLNNNTPAQNQSITPSNTPGSK